MGVNKSDKSRCVVCGDSSPEEGFSPRYRNTCKPCAREKSRQATFRKTGIMPRARYPWTGTEKVCNECGKLKHEDEYSFRDTPGGNRIRNSVCKECIGNAQKEIGKKPETRKRMRASQQKYLSNPENRLKTKNSRYLKEYGITLAEKEAMILQNGGRCPICKTDDPGKWWATDHCHRTGKVRGIICDKCNKMLGLANDDISRLMSAAQYLSNHYLNREPGEERQGVPKPEDELEGDEE